MLCVLSGAAAAADLPARVAAPAPFYAPPVFTWTGFYIGANAGAAWRSHSGCPQRTYYDGDVLVNDTSFAPNCDNNSNTAFIGGGQAGYNWQTGAFVFGVEGDVDWFGSGHNRSFHVTEHNYYGDYPVTDDFVSNGHNGTLLSTIRGRLGFALDRSLFYVTGGVAFRDTGSDGDVVWTRTWGDGSSTKATFSRDHADNNKVGWALGVGFEYAFTDSLSAKFEYLHAGFDRDNGLFKNPDCDIVFADRRNNSIDTVRVGLNWRFGAPAPVAVSPVSARY